MILIQRSVKVCDKILSQDTILLHLIVVEITYRIKIDIVVVMHLPL